MTQSAGHRTLLFVVGGLLVVASILALSSIFIVHQTQQALVLRFGEPVAGRGLVSDPGLHFKLPLIEDVIEIDKRILNLESPNQEVLASDNTRIEVDAFLRYKIVDPLTFYQTVQDVTRANGQLGYIMNSAIRRVLGEADLGQIVSEKRAALMSKIRDEVNVETMRLGIATVDVRIRRADLPRQISEQVYARMSSERAREAAEYRAQGAQEKQTIEAKADRDVVVLLGTAQKQADQLRGEGDAIRIRTFADAYGRDPAFFAFYRSLGAYEAAFKNNTQFVLAPTGDFFRYFKTPGQTLTPPSGGAPNP